MRPGEKKMPQRPTEKKMPQKQPNEDAEGKGKGKAQDKGKAGQRQGEGSWPSGDKGSWPLHWQRQWLAHEDNESEKRLKAVLDRKRQRTYLPHEDKGKGKDTRKKKGEAKAGKGTGKENGEDKADNAMAEDSRWGRRLKKAVDRWQKGEDKGRDKGLGLRV
jgi:hypothetical protein